MIWRVKRCMTSKSTYFFFSSKHGRCRALLVLPQLMMTSYRPFWCLRQMSGSAFLFFNSHLDLRGSTFRGHGLEKSNWNCNSERDMPPHPHSKWHLCQHNWPFCKYWHHTTAKAGKTMTAFLPLLMSWTGGEKIASFAKIQGGSICKTATWPVKLRKSVKISHGAAVVQR